MTSSKCIFSKGENNCVLLLSDGTLARFILRNHDIDKLSLHKNFIPGLHQDPVLSAAASQKFIVSLISGSRVVISPTAPNHNFNPSEPLHVVNMPVNACVKVRNMLS